MSSLPFSNVDMKDGLQTTTQSRTGSYKSLSQNQQSYFHLKPPPPRKTQTDLSGNHRDMLDQYQMDEDTARHHRQTRGPSRGPPNGYGLYNMHSNKETEDEEPRIIKDPGLFYNGKHFMKFLERFERTALAYQASGYNKALQILWFIQPEELKVQLEAMDGYGDCDWTTLRKSMVESWGELDNTVLYTNQDLAQVSNDVRKEGGLKNYQQYKTYLGKFTPILKYLVNNGHLYRKEEASQLFLTAFSINNQRSIKRALVSAGKLPKGKDRSEQPPLWEHATAAAEIEIHVIENGGILSVSNFPESSYQIQKSLDNQEDNNQRQNQMINLMDIPMALTHTVINIQDITMEEMDTFQQINAQSGMQEKETTHLNNVSLDQVNLKGGKTIYWVHNVNKLKDRITNRNSFKSHLSQYMKYSSTPTLEKPMDVADMVMDVADTVMDIADTVMDVADTVFGLMANTKDFEKRKMDLEDMKMNLNEDLLMKDIGYIKTVPGATRDDNQCSTKPTIYWIHNVNKLKEKIFNKHLFKPHSSLFKYVQIFCVPQKLKLKETEQGTDEEDLISISVPITITKAAAINAPVHPIPAVLPIIPEECFPNLLPPVPPDTTQPPEYSNDILGKETAITTFSSDKSINNQWRCQLNKVNYLLLFYLLHNFDSQIPPQIKPEGIGQLYSKVGFQRILVGVG
ncbi:hypothetical protein Pst134EA_002891 [Puccinia striiformis f. sp. tritici]|uniref:hypothetical protein n=1 Tax=Puccinia striiformis f. sp. tritici TaxID=168172 RepID=UPI002008B5EA|nr:hypothetical protein Pst134EA_002891 [Puccinia striiformis f. sp. tritici]KAH9472268.1 hypothetical protein Pst134EA_002891 [Puccinia striiformis f. sp. tritici]